MSIKINRRAQIAPAVLVLGACLALAACGGSSKSPTTSANAAATGAATSSAPGAGAAGGPSGPSGPTGAFHSRLSALRECLQKNGVTLPPRIPGSPPHYGGGFLGGGAEPGLPAGVSRQQLEAAMQKCGGPHLGRLGASGRFGATGRFGASGRFASPFFKALLTKFAACMRENGIKVPPPNTSGSGPVFNTTGIDTKSPQFTAALGKCRSDLRVYRPGAINPGGG